MNFKRVCGLLEIKRAYFFVYFLVFSSRQRLHCLGPVHTYPDTFDNGYTFFLDGQKERFSNTMTKKLEFSALGQMAANCLTFGGLCLPQGACVRNLRMLNM